MEINQSDQGNGGRFMSELDDSFEADGPRAGDVLRILWRFRVSLLLGIASGCVISVVAFFATPVKYEAVAVVRLAQVAGVLVESQAQAVFRFRIPAFVAAAELKRDLSMENLIRQIDASPLKSPESIELRYRSNTAQSAADGAKKLVEVLAQRQAELAEPSIEALKKRLEEAQKVRESSEQRRERLLSRSAPNSAPARLENFSFIESAFATQDVELARWQSDVQTSLAAPSTLPTRLMEKISVDDRAVSPKPLLFLVGGLVGGALLGLFIVFIRVSLRRRPRSEGRAR